MWRATVEGRQRVKHYKSLSWQPALVLCCFTEVSLWWKIFQWQKTLAAEVIHCCCGSLVLARESEWVRQFWEQQWPASVPCHALLMWECMLWWSGLYWEMQQIRADLDYLPVATTKSLSEAWQAACYVIHYGEEQQDNAYGSFQSNVSLQSRCFTAFLIDSWMHSIYTGVYCGLMHELSGDNTQNL